MYQGDDGIKFENQNILELRSSKILKLKDDQFILLQPDLKSSNCSYGFKTSKSISMAMDHGSGPDSGLQTSGPEIQTRIGIRLIQSVQTVSNYGVRWSRTLKS